MTIGNLYNGGEDKLDSMTCNVNAASITPPPYPPKGGMFYGADGRII